MPATALALAALALLAACGPGTGTVGPRAAASPRARAVGAPAAGAPAAPLPSATPPLADGELGAWDPGWEAVDVALAGGYALVAGKQGSLRVVDLADPARPLEVAAWGQDGLAWPADQVVADGDTADLALAGEVVHLDLSDPRAPRPLAWLLGAGLDSRTRIAAAAGRVYAAAAPGLTPDGRPRPGGDRLAVLDPAADLVPGAEWDAALPLAGPVTALAAAGELLVANLGEAGLQVFGLEDPDRPRALGRLDPDWTPLSVRLVGRRALVAATLPTTEGALVILDLAEPGRPRELGRWSPPAPRAGAEDGPESPPRVVSADGVGDRAVLLLRRDDGMHTLALLDLADPARPREVARLAGEGWPRLENEPEVRLAGDLALVSGGRAGLRVVDLAGPAPREVGALDTPDGAFDLALAGDRAYVAAWNDGLRILDVADPAHPRELGAFDPPGRVVGVAVAGETAFVAAAEDGLLVLDTTDPGSPREIARYDVADRAPEPDTWSAEDAGQALGVALDGDHAYLATNHEGLVVLDVSDPAAPRRLGTTAGEDAVKPSAVVLDRGRAYVDEWTRLTILDVADPAQPRVLGRYDLPLPPDKVPDPERTIQDIAVAGDILALALGRDGALLLDVADPAAPRLRRRLAPPDCGMGAGTGEDGATVRGVALDGDRLWLAGWPCGAELDLGATPPTILRTLAAPGMGLRVRLAGPAVYVAAADGGLRILPRAVPVP